MSLVTHLYDLQAYVIKNEMQTAEGTLIKVMIPVEGIREVTRHIKNLEELSHLHEYHYVQIDKAARVIQAFKKHEIAFIAKEKPEATLAEV